MLAPVSRNALLYAVCGDDIHARMRVATRFFPNRSVNEKKFSLFLAHMRPTSQNKPNQTPEQGF